MAGCAAAAVCAAALLTALAPPQAGAINTEQLLFLEAWKAVDRAYVDKGFNGNTWFRVKEQFLKDEPMRDREQTYAAIRKMLALLDDPFTRLLEPQQYAVLKRGASGSVTGVGVEVAFSQNPRSRGQLLVVAPSPGSPADKAGIRPQDALVAIDGTATEGLSIYEAASLLQGEQGTAVTLTVRPRGQQRSHDLVLTRAKVQIQSVSSDVCAAPNAAVGAPQGAKLGYLRVATFNKQTAAAFRSTLRALQGQGVGALVLDLRNNGGGSFPAGVEVARMLVPAGDVVLIADTKGVKDIYASNPNILEDDSTKLAVLVNGGTASAAEVLSGAIQDSKRGTIVGEQTFGKGLVQSIVPLDEEDGSAVVVTVARYQTPIGRDINKKGIAPDVGVAAGALPLDSVCAVLQSGDAPKLFQ